MTTKKDENMSFETALSSLENIVQQLEKGDLPLEQAMALFEQGLALSKTTQQTLQQAEQKIKVLMDKHQDAPLQDFELTQDDQ
ncbi:exodeoxyribonuclease VII small subunit [Thalassotalea agarivorans]|uniref:Exodeoxyribonuclease 7 small subunit n=1 Tax=Thalassotalea agarivorans TaxID=349064 RepID=A0A1I0AMK4_THASX|nr:exodeoxyribonuclease VII small subunit [Thalassotalea agarivorans]SES95550.1 Exodeoxyribonuclease VII small subunit [Thalassotalea agarivorans]